jgi:hypothetical protein
MRFAVCWSIAALVVVIAGCAIYPKSEATEVARVVVTPETQRYLDEVGSVTKPVVHGGYGLGPGSAEWRRVAVNNALATDYYRNRESRHYRVRSADMQRGGELSWPRGLPKRCLALSGGGVRSAAYAMGAMDALHGLGMLDDVDVISSSSGGSYANYWLTHALTSGMPPSEVFAGPASSALVSVREHAARIAGKWWTVGPILNVLDALDGLPAFSSITRALIPMDRFQPFEGTFEYSRAIRRIFATGPALSFSWKLGLSLDEVGPRLDAVDAPLPVINTTARVGKGKACADTSLLAMMDTRSEGLATAVFEFTPWRVGSDGVGFAPSPGNIAFALTVAASASAIDDPNAKRCPWLGLAGLRTGLVNNFFHPVPDIAQAGAKESRPADSIHVTLVDAAFSDNLAAYAVVRRLCEEMIIIDAEHDPTLIFESYGYLKQHLAKDGFDLSVPEVDEIAARNRVDCTAAGAECTCQRGICLLFAREECLRYGPENNCIRPTALRRPVFVGAIRGIPFIDESGGTPRALDIKVTYLKLALDEDQLETYPSQVRARYSKHAPRRVDSTMVCQGQGMKELCSFPHESTYDQDFRGGKFEAYWELGRCNAERFMGGHVPLDRCLDEPWPELSESP